MIAKVSDNIISPLGIGTQANYEAVLRGKSALQTHSCLGVPKPFFASIMTDELAQREGYTRFENICIAAAEGAIKDAAIDPSAPSTLFVLATTKANVDSLATSPTHNIFTAARKVATYFGNQRNPIVVCNACVSGLSAQIEAFRAIEAGLCQVAIVVAADVLSHFIVSGFRSLMALSDEQCRPFDEERLGLNLGEGAACAIFSADAKGGWTITSDATRNDAYHVSAPSKQAEGAFRALQAVDASGIDFINVHGTATMYNDEMEAVALHRAGLTNVPVVALKGYFGHTMGAAGLIETLICCRAAEDNIILGSHGFRSLGVSKKINIAAENRVGEGNKSFLKMMSGFGGVNVAAVFKYI